MEHMQKSNSTLKNSRYIKPFSGGMLGRIPTKALSLETGSCKSQATFIRMLRYLITVGLNMDGGQIALLERELARCRLSMALMIMSYYFLLELLILAQKIVTESSRSWRRLVKNGGMI